MSNNDKYNKEKYIYDRIIKMEELYNNSFMNDIKENLYQIKIQRRDAYVKDCKRNNRKIGKFRLLEKLGISQSSEKAFTSTSHHVNIPFLTLIKICSFLHITIEEITKPAAERLKRVSHFQVKWTEKTIAEFIKDYDKGTIEKIALKYHISKNSVIRYYEHFSKSEDINGNLRTIE